MGENIAFLGDVIIVFIYTTHGNYKTGVQAALYGLAQKCTVTYEFPFTVEWSIIHVQTLAVLF